MSAASEPQEHSRAFATISGPRLLTIAILAVWLTAVVFTVSRHEFWRDEVRALSLVRAAGSLTELYELVKYDGHPVLWYLLLYIGTSIVDSGLVLPVTSIAVGFAAVALFMIAAPFPYAVRVVFIFSALPFYEYSVMARNYGISMLLLFLAAALYPSRSERPIRLALVLALMANTNAHSVIFVLLISALWASEVLVDLRGTHPRVRRPSFSAAAIILAGLLLSVAFAIPRQNTIVTPVRSLGPGPVALSFVKSAAGPHASFSELTPSMPSVLAGGAVWIAVLGLLPHPRLFLAAFGAQIALGMFFRLAYSGFYRHQGLFLLFLLFLYWVAFEWRDVRDGGGSEKSMPLRNVRRRQVMLRTGLYVGLLPLILANVLQSSRLVAGDLMLERSSGKAFGEFLSRSDQYRDAIIVPEPDFLLESLPYYAGNAIYFPREDRFGTTVSWTTASRNDLSLGEVLMAARRLSQEHHRPVLIVLGRRWDFGKLQPGEHTYLFGKVFSWNGSELEEFQTATEFIAEFRAELGDESYRVYALRPEPPSG